MKSSILYILILEIQFSSSRGNHIHPLPYPCCSLVCRLVKILKDPTCDVTDYKKLSLGYNMSTVDRLNPFFTVHDFVPNLVSRRQSTHNDNLLFFDDAIPVDFDLCDKQCEKSNWNKPNMPLWRPLSLNDLTCLVLLDWEMSEWSGIYSPQLAGYSRRHLRHWLTNIHKTYHWSAAVCHSYSVFYWSQPPVGE